MTNRKIFITTVLFLSTCLYALPQIVHAGENVLSLNSAIEEALRSNPEIKAAKNTYEAAGARIPQAASLNDPMIEYEYNKILADRALTGDPMKTYTITQEVPFPTKLYLKAKIAAKLARIDYENYKLKERDIIARVKTAYAELSLIRKSIEINTENKTILDQLAKTALARYSAEKGEQSEALKAQIECAKADIELIMLDQREATGKARLNALLNRPLQDGIGELSPEGPVPSVLTLETLTSLAFDNNQELKAYKIGIEKGKASRALAVNEFLPDFKFKYSQMIGRDRFLDKYWAGMIGATVPLWFFQKQAFGVKEMNRELEMLKAEYKAKENEVLLNLKDAKTRVEANTKLVELYETAFLPQGEEAAASATKAYESEKIDLLSLLDTRRMLLDFKLDHYKAILDLRMALADLEKVVGVDISAVNQGGINEKK